MIPENFDKAQDKLADLKNSQNGRRLLDNEDLSIEIKIAGRLVFTYFPKQPLSDKNDNIGHDFFTLWRERLDKRVQTLESELREL